MKNIKKLFLSVITLIISIFTINVVDAEGIGTITINGTTEGKTYEIYKIFDLTYSGSNVSYTIDNDWINFFNEGGLGESYIVDENNQDNSLNPITIGNITKYINITESNKVEFSEIALEYIASNNLTSDSAKVGDETTTVEFTNLDLGYYLVYPKGATDIKETYSTICSLTSTMPNATMNVKAEYPEITKIADKETVDVGELVKFTITGQVPTTTGYTKYTYMISDTWTSGLVLPSDDKIDFTVKFGDTIITDVIPTYTTNGFTLEFDMTKYQDYKGEEITVTYNLKVTEDAISIDTNNSATLTYSTNPKDEEEKVTTPPVIVKVYSSEIIINKFDASNEDTKLEGAKFILSKVNEDGVTVYYQAINDDGIITSTTETLIYTTTGLTEVKWVTNKEDASVLTTNNLGVIEFKGIENGNYSLIEIEAPNGYNLLPEPVDVTLEPEDEEVTKSVSMFVDVANSSGTELPTTGGIGTKIFMLLGSLLMGISSLILITNKRITKED